MTEMDPLSKLFDIRPQPTEELYPISLGPLLEQVTHIGSNLSKELRGRLVSLLQQNIDLSS